MKGKLDCSLPATFILKVIRFYQTKISVRTSSKCKYLPTCSQYALEAITRYGAIKGLWLAIWRILRCNPFSKGGYDPLK